MVTTGKTYQAYYTHSAPLVDYLVQRLELSEGLTVLEPAAGDGVLAAAVLAQGKRVNLDLFELNVEAYAGLCRKYGDCAGVKITLTDTLLAPELHLAANFGGRYDRIIANPPYGGWQDYGKRKQLKTLFPNFYVKETYALFLARCIGLLRTRGRLVFLLPDTWLNLHRHSYLREYLLRHTQIKEITLFPSHFFPCVNFGYANLSVVVLEKCDTEQACLANKFIVRKGFSRVEELAHKVAVPLEFSQRETLNNLDHAFFVSEQNGLTALINQPGQRIGDIASCVTGFYSGDDKKYLRPINSQLKNAKNYQLLPPALINRNYLTEPALLDGLATPECYLPIVKGGKARYYKPDGWYADWSREAVQHYRTDSKARFQNPAYYFRFGVGVPMVTSGDISASLIERNLFDQSIVGIFPYDEAWIYYLLAFFNSPVCSRLIRAINPSANNSANYIKKIPFVEPTPQIFAEITALTKALVAQIKTTGSYAQSDESKIHQMFDELYHNAASALTTYHKNNYDTARL